MRVIKWIVLSIVIAFLIFVAFQAFLLNEKGLDQSKTLTQLHQQVSLLNDSVLEQSKVLLQLQLEQNSDDFTRILDLGINVGTFPYTNHRGTTAIAAMPIGSPSPLPGPVVYILRDGTHPKMLLDILAYNKNYTSVDPIFVTASDTVLAFTGDYSDRNHILAKILRITLDGEVTEVYSYDSGTQDPGGYFWGEDSRTGAIWKGHMVQDGTRIIKSTDDGRTWTVKYTAAYTPPSQVYEIAAFNDKVFAALQGLHTVLFSDDGGNNWREVLNAGITIEGVSIFGELVYAVTAGEEIYFAHYEHPEKWQRVYLPRGISLMNTTIFRQAKMLGRYIVTCGIAGIDTVTYWATADNFYTISPLFRFGPTNRGMNERYSGFGNTIYIGGSSYGDGTVWKGKVPESLSVHIPTLRTVVSMGSLAGGATSSLDDSSVFDSRLSSTFTLNVTAVFDSSATQGIKIHIISSGDGRNFDTEDTYTAIHPFSAGQTVRKTYLFNGSGVIKIRIENLDSFYAVKNIDVIGTLGALGD